LLLQALQESWSGISQVTLMQKLAQSEDVSIVIPHLKAIAEHVLDSSLMRCNIVGEEGSLPKAEQKLSDLLAGIKSAAHQSSAADYQVRLSLAPWSSLLSVRAC
jgi:Zn-dependent M16 (insulinase) family peptidase